MLAKGNAPSRWARWAGVAVLLALAVCGGTAEQDGVKTETPVDKVDPASSKWREMFFPNTLNRMEEELEYQTPNPEYIFPGSQFFQLGFGLDGKFRTERIFDLDPPDINAKVWGYPEWGVKRDYHDHMVYYPSRGMLYFAPEGISCKVRPECNFESKTEIYSSMSQMNNKYAGKFSLVKMPPVQIPTSVTERMQSQEYHYMNTRLTCSVFEAKRTKSQRFSLPFMQLLFEAGLVEVEVDSSSAEDVEYPRGDSDLLSGAGAMKLKKLQESSSLSQANQAAGDAIALGKTVRGRTVRTRRRVSKRQKRKLLLLEKKQPDHLTPLKVSDPSQNHAKRGGESALEGGKAQASPLEGELESVLADADKIAHKLTADVLLELLATSGDSASEQGGNGGAHGPPGSKAKQRKATRPHVDTKCATVDYRDARGWADCVAQVSLFEATAFVNPYRMPGRFFHKLFSDFGVQYLKSVVLGGEVVSHTTVSNEATKNMGSSSWAQNLGDLIKFSVMDSPEPDPKFVGAMNLGATEGSIKLVEKAPPPERTAEEVAADILESMKAALAVRGSSKAWEDTKAMADSTDVGKESSHSEETCAYEMSVTTEARGGSAGSFDGSNWSEWSGGVDGNPVPLISNENTVFENVCDALAKVEDYQYKRETSQETLEGDFNMPEQYRWKYTYPDKGLDFPSLMHACLFRMKWFVREHNVKYRIQDDETDIILTIPPMTIEGKFDMVRLTFIERQLDNKGGFEKGPRKIVWDVPRTQLTQQADTNPPKTDTDHREFTFSPVRVRKPFSLGTNHPVMVHIEALSFVKTTAHKWNPFKATNTSYSRTRVNIVWNNSITHMTTTGIDDQKETTNVFALVTDMINGGQYFWRMSLCNQDKQCDDVDTDKRDNLKSETRLSFVGRLSKALTLRTSCKSNTMKDSTGCTAGANKGKDFTRVATSFVKMLSDPERSKSPYAIIQVFGEVVEEQYIEENGKVSTRHIDPPNSSEKGDKFHNCPIFVGIKGRGASWLKTFTDVRMFSWKGEKMDDAEVELFQNFKSVSAVVSSLRCRLRIEKILFTVHNVQTVSENGFGQSQKASNIAQSLRDRHRIFQGKTYEANFDFHAIVGPPSQENMINRAWGTFKRFFGNMAKRVVSKTKQGVALSKWKIGKWGSKLGRGIKNKLGNHQHDGPKGLDNRDFDDNSQEGRPDTGVWERMLPDPPEYMLEIEAMMAPVESGFEL